jgi:hypothetical protein
MLVAQETRAHQACQARQDGAVSGAHDLRPVVLALADKWEKEAKQYQRQVEEARAKGTPADQMISMMTCLRLCAKDIREKLNT